MITSASLLKKSADHIEATVDGEVVLMHTVSGKFFSLSETGLRVWQLMGDQESFASLVDKLLEEFDITRDDCEKDVAELCKNFSERALLEIS